jgi:hypothetical protein
VDCHRIESSLKCAKVDAKAAQPTSDGSREREEKMTTWATDSRAKKRKAAAYHRRWRRGLIAKRSSVTKLAPYITGYNRGYRAGRKAREYGWRKAA